MRTTTNKGDAQNCRTNLSCADTLIQIRMSIYHLHPSRRTKTARKKNHTDTMNNVIVVMKWALSRTTNTHALLSLSAPCQEKTIPRHQKRKKTRWLRDRNQQRNVARYRTSATDDTSAFAGVPDRHAFWKGVLALSVLRTPPNLPNIHIGRSKH